MKKIIKEEFNALKMTRPPEIGQGCEGKTIIARKLSTILN
jgi:hypothetical protein